MRALATQVDGLRLLHSVQHDPSAFTQGLSIHRGRLYESTGMYGASDIRIVDPVDGAGECCRAAHTCIGVQHSVEVVVVHVCRWC
jgi:glutamine cyclotransferase